MFEIPERTHNTEAATRWERVWPSNSKPEAPKSIGDTVGPLLWGARKKSSSSYGSQEGSQFNMRFTERSVRRTGCKIGDRYCM